eukprot:TRINITY_DN73150_c0_g1_i1.p1 TRINITY_DN73150_c0_g1~~TRINITY_DN73150_c0_g1_i1.p1  ORF type:complete len:475 (-),score=88.01 TRINITY_DN73150_c0_g1_i1:101-1525(-)
MATAVAAPAPAGAVSAKPTEERFICFLCKRKFKSLQLLMRHRQLSELHRRNLVRQDEEIQQKKEECRQAANLARKQLQDVEAAIGKQVPPDQELNDKRGVLDTRMRQAMLEYGQQQERLEVSRMQQTAERAGSEIRPTRTTQAYETRLGPLLVSAGVASWQGNKDVQEDRFIMEVNLKGPGGEQLIGFAVLDGHSGSLCVDACVQELPRNLQKCISAKQSLSEDSLREAVGEAIALTDADFLVKAREREVLDGSTMILCLIWPGETRGRGGRHRLLIANLGDSRAVLCRAQGGRLAAVRLSDDHKPGRADERSRIEECGGVVDVQGVWRVFTPGPANFGGRSLLWGLAVSRAFGDLLMKEPQKYGCQGATGELVTAVPEIHTYDLRPSDDRFIVLACDGIWDVLGDDDAVAVCTEHRSTEQAAHALIRRAFESGSDDNITALVIAWQMEAQGTDGAGGTPANNESATKKLRVVD